MAGLSKGIENYRRLREEILKKAWKKKAKIGMWQGLWEMDETEKSRTCQKREVKEKGESWSYQKEVGAIEGKSSQERVLWIKVEVKE